MPGCMDQIALKFRSISSGNNLPIQIGPNWWILKIHPKFDLGQTVHSYHVLILCLWYRMCLLFNCSLFSDPNGKEISKTFIWPYWSRSHPIGYLRHCMSEGGFSDLAVGEIGEQTSSYLQWRYWRVYWSIPASRSAQMLCISRDSDPSIGFCASLLNTVQGVCIVTLGEDVWYWQGNNKSNEKKTKAATTSKDR